MPFEIDCRCHETSPTQKMDEGETAPQPAPLKESTMAEIFCRHSEREKQQPKSVSTNETPSKTGIFDHKPALIDNSVRRSKEELESQKSYILYRYISAV